MQHTEGSSTTRSALPFGRLALGALALTFVPYFASAVFNEPSMDDYRYASNYLSNDFWYLQAHMYKYWCGRYAATALLYLGPLSFGSFLAYKLVPIVLLLFLIWSIYFMLWTQLSFLAPLRRHLVILLASALWLSCLPSISQGIYWFSGAYTYLPAVVLFNVLLGLLFRLRGFLVAAPQWEIRPVWQEVVFVAAGGLLMMVAMGLNEVIAIYALMILFVINAAAWWVRGKPDISLVLISLFALGFALLSYVAPGNAIRAEGYTRSRDVVLTLWKSPAYLVWFAQYFLSLPLLLAAVAVIRPVAARISLFPDWLYGSAARWVVLALILGMSLATFVLGVWATGARPARRALNVLHYYDSALLLIAWFQWVLAYPDFWKRLRSRLPLTDTALLVGGVLLLFVSGNVREAWVDLLHRGPAYHQEMGERYAAIAQGGDVVVPPIVNKPKTLFFEDITEETEIWQNVEMARYFGVKSIRLSERDQNHPLRE